MKALLSPHGTAKWHIHLTVAALLAALAAALAVPGSAQVEPGIPGYLQGTGTHFEITDSEYLNITLDSSEAITVLLQSIPEMLVLHVEAAAGAPSAQLTLSGLVPLTEYHLYLDGYRNHQTFASDGSGSYTWTQDLSAPHLVFVQPRGSTKYISDDATGGDCQPGGPSDIGLWNDLTNTCTLTTDVNDTILIEDDGITLDGAGHTITGTGTGCGVYVGGLTDVTIRNLTIRLFASGIWLGSSTTASTVACNSVGPGNYIGITLMPGSGITLRGNHVTGSGHAGIGLLAQSDGNVLTGNTISSSGNIGVVVYGSDNLVYNNNFDANPDQAVVQEDSGNLFHLPSPIGGNYWSHWTGPDADGDGFVDVPVPFTGGQDDLAWTVQDGWQPRPLYVKHDAAGNNAGSSWTDAYVDLQSALAAACYGDEIWVAAGTYKPTAGTVQSDTFHLLSGVELYGGFAGWETSRDDRDWVNNATILSGEIGNPAITNDNSYRVVTGSGTDATAVLDGFTISRGSAFGTGVEGGGGVYNKLGSPTLRHLIIERNYAELKGGGMCNLYSTPQLSDVTFYDNYSFWEGGGMYNEFSNPILTDVTFTDNRGAYGGGVSNRDSSPTLTRVTFSGGYAIWGTAMMNAANSNVTLTEVTFSGGYADQFGCAMYNSGATVTVTQGTFSYGHAEDHGGAIYNTDSTVTLTEVTLRDNYATNRGGAIYNSDSTTTLTHSTIRDNVAQSSGGGIYNDSGSVALEGCNVINNTVLGSGGGIYNGDGADLTLSASTVALNGARGSGGGIAGLGTQYLVNSTLSDNKAGGSGGGILELGSATTHLLNVTITGNVADYDYDAAGEGGGLANLGGVVYVKNSIIAGNVDHSGVQHPDCSADALASFPLLAYNLIGDNTGCSDFVDGVDGNQVGVDPDLGRLAFNGGWTPTHALLAESLARDAGDPAGCTDHLGAPLITDQRGVPRHRDGDGDGSLVCDVGSYEAGLGNDAWHRAQPLTLNSQATVEQYLGKLGQSRWFRFPVVPGSRVIVELANLPANYDLVLFKDIHAAFEELVAPEELSDLVELTAEFAPDAYSPDAYSPDAYSPDAYSPDAYSPDAYSPDAYSPDAYSPDAYSPDAYSPDAYSPDAYSPDAYSPDAYSEDVFSPDAYSPDAYSPDGAYSVAQMHSLIGVSAFDGTAGESIEANTWDNAGDFFIRVRGRNGAFDVTAPFYLTVTMEVGVCDGVDPNLPPRSLDPAVGDFKTIILTDPGRMNLDAAEEAALSASLQAFAAANEVMGAIVDVGEDDAVAFANSQADAKPECPYAKNLVASAIKDIIKAYREMYPDLEYVLVIGNDEVIPFFRHPDRALLANEKNYKPPVYQNTSSAASLALGYVLSQDAYGSSVDLSLSNTVLAIPDLAVGRLVETAADIIHMLDAYAALTGGALPIPGSAFVSGYDFLYDTALEVQAELEAGIGAPADTLLAARDVAPLDPAAWTADDLRAGFLGQRHDVIFLAGHFSAFSALAADYSSRLLASEVVSSPVDLENALIFSAGCHSGYNSVNEHGVPDLTREPDWAQAFAQKGATFIGGTGYQYGDTDFIEYSERLYLEFSKQLRYGFGPVSIGKALVAAKHTYLAETAQMRGIHEKALLEATLFGLPMLSINMPQNRHLPPVLEHIVPATFPYATDPGFTLGLEHACPPVSFTLTSNIVTLHSVSGTSTIDAQYYSGSDGVVSNPAEPVLPLELYDVSVPGMVLRGVGIRSMSYTDHHGVIPLTGAAATEIRGVHPPFHSDVFFPIRPWRVNYFDVLANPGAGTTRLAVTPAQFMSDGSGGYTGTLREFHDMEFCLFYSNNWTTFALGSVPALAAPPSILKVLATSHGGQVTFKVIVAGDPAAGIQEVWVTYTQCDEAGICDGVWQPLDLWQSTADSTLWQETLSLGGIPPEELRYMVQAVNGVGLVAMATNMGEFFVVDVDPADPSAGDDGDSPPADTNLVFDSPPISGAYNTAVSFSAILTSNGGPLSGQTVSFALGSQRRQAMTDLDGVATVSIPLLGVPGPHEVRASFAGNVDYLQSSAAEPFTILKQATQLDLVPDPGTAQYSDDAALHALLTDADERTLREMTVILVVSAGDDSYAVSEITNFVSEAPLGPVPLPAGSYAVTAHFGDVVTLPDGSTLDLTDVNYLPATAAGTLIVIPENAMVTYTGDTSVPAASTTLNLAALVFQADDGAPGDLTLAQVQYQIWDEGGSLVDTVIAAVASDGTSTATSGELLPGSYSVDVTLVGGYFAAVGVPEVGAVVGLPLDPIQAPGEISAAAEFTDADGQGAHIAVWDWGDGTQCDTSLDEDCTLTEPSGSAPGTVSGSHIYLEPGVYTIVLTVTDGDSLFGQVIYQFVVVYDPDSGFVTGGGWITSPPGACRYEACVGDPTGKASFGFVSRYHRRKSNVPTGTTEFQFKAGNLDFRSESYQWMVVVRHRAYFKGVGTINGVGNYGFLISAIDAALTPSTDVDLFRIKIWDRDNNDFVVYDNQMGAEEAAEPTTAIDGGSIVIHKAK